MLKNFDLYFVDLQSFIRNKLKWHLCILASHYDVWVMWINTSLAGSWKFFFIKSTNTFLWLVSVIFQANGFETSERIHKIIFQEPQKPHSRKCHHFAIDYNFLFLKPKEFHRQNLNIIHWTLREYRYLL